ncbi:hypothetical protein K474DRAFT_1519912 [Panus rudis PR-1116 ss-1]|nr:hypothetical protein K474DRAFT_1519912 [Panus rudis PR-1116 ss-1]
MLSVPSTIDSIELGVTNELEEMPITGNPNGTPTRSISYKLKALKLPPKTEEKVSDDTPSRRTLRDCFTTRIETAQRLVSYRGAPNDRGERRIAAAMSDGGGPCTYGDGILRRAVLRVIFEISRLISRLSHSYRRSGLCHMCHSGERSPRLANNSKTCHLPCSNPAGYPSAMT